jgi:hypothetical protein
MLGGGSSDTPAAKTVQVPHVQSILSIAFYRFLSIAFYAVVSATVVWRFPALTSHKWSSPGSSEFSDASRIPKQQTAYDTT